MNNCSKLTPSSNLGFVGLGNALPAPSIDSTLAGTLSDGSTVKQYLLKAGKTQLSLMEYGATMTHWFCPDKHGNTADILLGYDTLADYETKPAYFGTITGRHAGRIDKGSVNINGRHYQLTINDGENHLHGGHQGLDKVIWKSWPETGKDFAAIHFSHLSLNGHEGFPGNVIISVSYYLYSNNELHIRYCASTDETTLLNLTQHAYFNLSGNQSQTILDHKLLVASDQILALRPDSIPTGERIHVEGTPFDFTSKTPLSTALATDHKQLSLAMGLDHYWTRRINDGSLNTIAELTQESSGRRLTVKTTEPGIQIYTANHLNPNIIGKAHTAYQKHSGICLETGQYPDAINHSNFPVKLLTPSETWQSTTVYSISTD